MLPSQKRGQKTPAIYRITVDVEPRLAQHWLAWMLDEHVPEVLGERGFVRATVSRDLEVDARFIVEYTLEDHDALEIFLNSEAAARHRATHDNRYAGKVRSQGQVLEPLAEIAVQRG